MKASQCLISLAKHTLPTRSHMLWHGAKLIWVTPVTGCLLPVLGLEHGGSFVAYGE